MPRAISLSAGWLMVRILRLEAIFMWLAALSLNRKSWRAVRCRRVLSKVRRCLPERPLASRTPLCKCDLQANNQIIVGIKSPERGRLAGGPARAMMLIRGTAARFIDQWRHLVVAWR